MVLYLVTKREIKQKKNIKNCYSRVKQKLILCAQIATQMHN